MTEESYITMVVGSHLFLFVFLSPSNTYHMYGDKYLENPSQHLKYN